MENEDMQNLIRLELQLEEIMHQVTYGNEMGLDYLWHTTRLALMDCRILIDRLYQSSNTVAECV